MKLLIFNNQTLRISEWASKVGLPSQVLRMRLNYGWSAERALTEALIPHRSGPLYISPVPLTYIELTRGQIALIDPEDYVRLAGYRWMAQRSEQGVWYAVRTVHTGTTSTSEHMHRVIMDAPRDKDVDHVNGNGLDNRKSNLRLVDDSVNQQNRHRMSLNTSGYRGVTWDKQSKKWRAGIKKTGKSYHLGLHTTREDAARAYDDGARRLYGPKAWTNFPTEVAA